MSPGRDGVPGTPSKGKGRRSKLAPHDEVPGTPKLKKVHCCCMCSCCCLRSCWSFLTGNRAMLVSHAVD